MNDISSSDRSYIVYCTAPNPFHCVCNQMMACYRPKHVAVSCYHHLLYNIVVFWLKASAVYFVIIIPMFLNCSTCFKRHHTHHREHKNCNCSLWFYICFVVAGSCHGSAMTAAGNHKRTSNQRLQLQFLSSRWWAACRLKHVE